MGSDASSRVAATKVRRRFTSSTEGYPVEVICARCGDHTAVDSGIFETYLRAICPRCMYNTGRSTQGI